MPAGDRVVEIERPDVFVRVADERLRIEENRRLIGEVPLTDLSTLVLSTPRATISRAVLDAVVRHGGSVVVCNGEHHPTAMLLPLVGHHHQTQRMHAQASASKPTLKRLWKQIVRAKVLAQAANLTAHRDTDAGLTEIARKVRSGDAANVEGWAAQRYWPKLMGKDFRRRPDGPPPNPLLNYGYAVLRAGTARAIAAAGLHPALGLHHHARGNPYCLADDLMEPFRPLVDALVVSCEARMSKRPGPRARGTVAGVLACRVPLEGEDRSVSDCLQRLTVSLAAVFLGERDALLLPGGLADAQTYR